MPEAPPPRALLRYGPREHTPCLSLMPISDGLGTADLCGTGTPRSLGDSTVFPNTKIPSQPASAEPQHLVEQGRCSRAFFSVGEKGQAWTTRRWTEATNESRETINWNRLGPFSRRIYQPWYGEVATGTEQKAFTNIVSVERFCSSALVMGWQTLALDNIDGWALLKWMSPNELPN